MSLDGTTRNSKHLSSASLEKSAATVSNKAFTENALIDRNLQVGTKAVIAVTDRDPRCKMITLDPDTAEARPEILRRVAQAHDGKAGLYGAVLVEGTIRSGDEIILLD